MIRQLLKMTDHVFFQVVQILWHAILIQLQDVTMAHVRILVVLIRAQAISIH